MPAKKKPNALKPGSKTTAQKRADKAKADARPLNPKQRQFTELWIKTGSKTEAYIATYQPAKSSQKTIHNRAYQLSNDARVIRYKAEIQKLAMDKTATDVATLDGMFRESFESAKMTFQAGAMVSATSGLMKLHGLDAEARAKIERLQKPAETMTPTELLQSMADLLPD